jgi:hypothetical protein
MARKSRMCRGIHNLLKNRVERKATRCPLSMDRAREGIQKTEDNLEIDGLHTQRAGDLLVMRLAVSDRNARRVYWTIPVLLCLAQLAFTVHSRSQVRYEELAESVRNVFWLEHRTIYDGISSNVGWYGTLLVTYKVFGFDLHTAKFVRFGLACVSVLALALVLRRFFEPRQAALPLLMIGLSPTLLYFNTLQTSYGIDLQYAPIVLYLVLALDVRRSRAEACRQLLVGAVSMIACMSYPTFLFYLPSLGMMYGQQVRAAKGLPGLVVAHNLLLCAIGAILPLAIVLMYVKDPRLLLFDPVMNSGIFRGAGSFSFNPADFTESLRHTVRDIFSRADSYYFEVAAVDFSGSYSLIAVAFVLAASVVFTLRSRDTRVPFLTAWTLMLFTGVVAHMTLDPSRASGLRRSTAVLASIYVLCTLAWHVVCHGERWARKWRPALAASVLVILAHHVAVLPRNYRHLPDRSPYQFGASPFFSIAASPSQSVDVYVREVQSAALKLQCTNASGPCRLQEMYAAVAGACLWNQLRCHDLLGYDEQTARFIPLRTGLWESYYWPH